MLLTEGSQSCDALDSVKKMRAKRMQISIGHNSRPIYDWVVVDLL